jgi:GNAT superfamily N-acetyltransferase
VAPPCAAAQPHRWAGKMMQPVIREYTSGDLNACRALWKELTEYHRDIYDDRSIGGADPGQGFETYLAHPKRRGSWVAEVDGRVIALAGLLVQGEEGEIEPVVVSQARRSEGVGSALVRHIVAEARAMGIRYLSVRPVARNREAIAFFVGQGFDLLGHVDLFQVVSGSRGTNWKSGISIHGHKLGY